MSIKHFLTACALAGLAACAPAIPDSGATGAVVDPGRGVGFEPSADRRRAVAAADLAAAADISSSPLPPAGQATSVVRAAPLASGTADPDLALASATADAQAAAANSGQGVVNASPSNPAPQLVSNPEISSENDFDVVSSQRSIEGDAARIAANRAQYEVVQPTALPDRADSDPNIVSYALQTRHPRGQPVYRRVGLNKAAKYARACAGYPSSDQAQIAFLEKGGPTRDRLGVDPDGDGYACDWDPTPFRRAASGG